MSRAVPRALGTLGTLGAAALLVPLTLTTPTSAATTAPTPAPAPPTPRTYTVTPLKFTVPTGGSRCVIDADLYRPAGTDAEHPAPAVLTTNGFGGSKSDGSTDATGRAFARRGYVGLAYSGLGFGKSGCLISLNDPRIDGTAASALVDFLAGTRAADDGTTVDYVTADRRGDPRVGMIGGSYGGAIQLATAAVDHRVDALVPMITWNDLAYSLAPQNAADRDVPGVFKWQWTNAFFLMGEGQPLLQPALDPSRVNRLPCLHFVDDACATIRTLNSGRYPADTTKALLDYARGVSPVSYLKDVKAPTLLVQGQADSLFNLNEATANYETLRAQGTPAKMIWQSWGHSGGRTDPESGELNFGRDNLETSYVGRRILAWFDRYLRHHKGTDTGPAFAYYRDWTDDPATAYATAPTLPGLSKKLYLSGDGKLVDNAKKVARGSRTYSNWPFPTSHSESSLAGLTGASDPAPRDTRGTYLDWTTEPLATATDVVGAPKATLKVISPRAERAQRSADAADKLVLFAKVYDVAPDGTKTLVHRLVAPVRVPDVTRPFTVTLPGIVHRYEKGHRIQFVIAASDDAYGGNKGIKPVTVASAPGKAGTVELPVVGR
ncbi:CocE/NonD family hydrolase [Streptomyces sp. NPDC046939]|uniref:CocE/NonD family hydrolase n=1 Tax=Streptomyces sp. NPDC046939 TaxID=3155376 RepID=UPI0033D9A9E1